ncbi:MAG: pyridoxal-phosphate dependent enzyme [Actinobacteria bacterium]|nr:pyridoxal-phosphate dependent enzyme [Actinomycetota bacterium]
MTEVAMAGGRALFERLHRMQDLVPFTPLADGLPTPLDQVDDRLWVKRDDLTSSVYGGNKVRKLEFLLPIAARRGALLVTAGGIGSHHVVATAVYARQLDLEVEAVLYPQPITDDVRRTQAHLREQGVRIRLTPHRYLMPLVLAQRMAALAPFRPYLLWPGASTPLGTLGYVSAALELVDGWDQPAPPDTVVAALGSGGTVVGLAIGLAMAGWTDTRVVGVRVADRSVTNTAVLGSMQAGTLALLALGGYVSCSAARPVEIDGRWFGPGYGHPTPAGDAAGERAASYGLEVEPTYTAKAFAAALARADAGERVVFVQTYAGG